MKIIHLFLICVTLSSAGYSQNTEVIRGNRNVTIKQTYVDDFQRLELSGSINVELVYNSKPSVEIEADNNLHEVIEFDVENGTLSFNITKRITSKRALKITVNYGGALEEISVSNSAEVRSLTSMELNNTSLKVADNSRAYLNIKAKAFEFKSSGKSKTRLNLSAETSKIELNDDSKLDALVNSEETSFDLYQRADATIEGDTNISRIRIDNSANFFGNNFSINTCNLITEGSSDTTIHVIDSLNVEASGDTATFIYGQPEIMLAKFLDSAKLQKKER